MPTRTLPQTLKFALEGHPGTLGLVGHKKPSSALPGQSWRWETLFRHSRGKAETETPSCNSVRLLTLGGQKIEKRYILQAEKPLNVIQRLGSLGVPVTGVVCFGLRRGGSSCSVCVWAQKKRNFAKHGASCGGPRFFIAIF